MKVPSEKLFSRRFVLGALLASSAVPAYAEGPTTSRRPVARPGDAARRVIPSIEDIIAGSGLSGKVGLVVANARTGQILETHNPVLGLPPASVAKALTAQYALDALGPTHVFRTRLVATGPIKQGKIHGDLVLVGGGDPMLDTNALAEMAAALKSTGITGVTGQFVVDANALPVIDRIDGGQPDYLGYNPAISGLNLNYNRVHFEWKKANQDWSVLMDARSENYRPEVSMARMRIVDRNSPIYTYAAMDGVDQWTVARKALGNGGSRWLPVRRPDLYAGEVFATLAGAQGITLKRPVAAENPMRGTVLVERKSAPLQRVLKTMLSYSTNLTAEIAGLSATAALEENVGSLQASAQRLNDWASSRLGAHKVRLVDHSGLGDGSRISASDMVTSLVRMGPDSTLASILKPIPMRDAKGNILRGSGVSIRAKTGTLNFVSGLAGFINTAGNTDLAFAIFAADMDKRSAIPVANREKPRGARGWNNQARKIQQGLIDRWTTLYGA